MGLSEREPSDCERTTSSVSRKQKCLLRPDARKQCAGDGASREEQRSVSDRQSLPFAREKTKSNNFFVRIIYPKSRITSCLQVASFAHALGKWYSLHLEIPFKGVAARCMQHDRPPVHATTQSEACYLCGLTTRIFPSEPGLSGTRPLVSVPQPCPL